MKIFHHYSKILVSIILFFIIGIAHLSAATFTVTSQDVSCKGGNNGSITINITSGPSTFQYFLYDGWPVPGNLLGFSGGTTATTWVFSSNITARDYTVVVKESGITSGIDVTVGEPVDFLVISIASQTDISCNGASDGQITVSATGGTSPYTYAVDASLYGAATIFPGLSPGAHIFYVKDSKGCQATVNATIVEPTVLSGSISSQTNVLCRGSATGSVTVAGAGGTTPYTYKIDAGVFGAPATFNGLLAGAHTVQIKDAHGCTTNIPVTITEPATVVSGSITSQTNVLCNGSATGSVTVAGAGGTPGYTYNIDAGAFGAPSTFNGLSAGAHTVQVKDANGCTSNVAVNITQPATAVSGSITSQTDVLCNGSSTGSVTILGSGGTPGYTYNIDGGAFGAPATFNALAAGSHPVQVKDANGCTKSIPVTITQPTLLVGSISSQTNVLCNGSSTGSVTVSGSGGTPGYTFNIDGGAFGAPATFNALAAGSHPVQVKDANGCTKNIAVTITQPAALGGSISSQTNVLCNGSATGSVTVSGSGGTPGYTYNIDGGAFGAPATFNGLLAGAHTVQVKDANGCTFNIPVTITQPATAVSGSISSQTNVLCNGSATGSVTVTGAGGVSPYTYNIDAGIFGGSGTFSLLSAGAHTVQVKDANGCTSNVAVNITQPATAVSGSITSQTDVLCNGSSTGSVTILGSGGTPGYTYNIDGGAFGAPATFNALAAGSHPVQVKDANGCTKSIPVTITQPALLVGSISSQTNVLCNGSSTGSVTVSGSGGTPAYTFNIDGGAFGAPATFNALAAGSHPAQVKDANGCTKNIAVTITQPAALGGSISSQTNVLCNGSATGSVTVSGSGGTPGYTYNIDGGAFGAPATFNALAAGAHTVQVKDANGCTFNIPVTITQPATAVSGSISSQTNVLCNGSATGSVTVTGAGGVSPYTYNIDAGIFGGSGTFSLLSAGAHTVQVKDANGCTANVAVNITQPATAVSGSITSQTDVLCNGSSTGSVTVLGSGGTPGYTYNIDGGAFGAPATFNALAAGSHPVQVKDANGCTKSIPVTITQPTLLVGSISSQTNVLCNGSSTGSVTVSGSGGTPGYTFNIDGGAFGAPATFNALAAGAHTAQVKDANGCTKNIAVTITQPAALGGSISSQTNVLCNGSATGSVTVSGSGGTPGYTYNIDGGAFGAPATFNALAAGAHTVQVKDANGCTFNIPVTITQPATAVSGSISSQTNVLCNGSSTGSVTVTGAGGVSPYTYNIDAGIFGGSGTFSLLSAGAHTVQVKDANGCTANVAVNITQPATAVSGSITSQTDVLCNGSSTGSVTVLGSGGTPGYTYNIDGGAFGAPATFSALAAGSHPVQVKDANGCTKSIPVTITQPALLVGSISSQTNVLCNGSSTGSVTVSGSGGTPGYTFNIDGGAFGAPATFNALAAGAHTAQVKDANGCTANIPVTITQTAAITISSQASTNLACNGSGNGSITIVGAGGTAPLQYTLNPGGIINTTGIFSNLAANTYTVSIDDANGCPPKISPPIIISEPTNISVSIDGTSVLNLPCFGNSNGIINITASGGTGPYIYSWTGPSGFISSSEDISGLGVGTYDLSVSDTKACSTVLPGFATIVEPTLLTSSAVATDITCKGLTNGTVTITALGGTSPYIYSRVPFPYQASETFIGLGKNTYTFNTKDANGCISGSSATVKEPLALAIPSEIKTDYNVCNGDSLGEVRILLVTGGVTPYEYSINGGIDFYPTGIFQKLPAGSYQTTVRDANGCLKNGNVNNISQPAKILISNFTSLDVTDCFGNSNGMIAIEATGGSGFITYNLDGSVDNLTGIFSSLGGGDHIITMTDTAACNVDTTVSLIQPDEIVFSGLVITDVTGCTGAGNGDINAIAGGGTGPYTYSFDGGAFQASGNFAALTAGTYDLKAKDSNGCIKDTTITVSEPLAVTIQNQAFTDITCPAAGDGTISITAAGGTGPYTYVLNPGALDTNNTGNFISLVAGSYTVSVTDNIGCGPAVTSAIQITEPSALSRDSVISKDISCSGLADAEIHIYVSGGTSPYSYSFDDAANFTATSDSTGMVPGVYHLSFSDARGCGLVLDTISIVDPAPVVMLSESKIDVVSCSGDPNGQVDFLAGGGTGSIEYSLDVTTWQATGTFAGLTGGDYTVTARDQNHCSLSSSVLTVDAPAPITADITTTPDLNEFNKGSITISNASGGTGTLVFSIDGPAGTFSSQTDYPGLDAGTYPVVVRDDNNCTLEQDAVVLSTPPLDVTLSYTHSSCNGANDGTISMVSSNGTDPLEYSIDDSTSWVNSGSFTGLLPGTYYVFTRDGLDRYFQDTVLLTEPSVINIFGNLTPSSCSSFSGDGAIDVSVNGGNSPYTYLWDGGETTQDLSNLNAGNYFLTVTDFKNCSNTRNFVLTAVTSVVADAGPDTTICFGETIILNGQGGAISSWAPTEGLSNPNISNPVVNITEDASYVLTVIGFNDCTAMDTIHISIRPGLGLNAGKDTTVRKNQEITLLATGGPYVSYSWLPVAGLATPDQASTIAHPLVSTNFIVSAITEFGCTESDTVQVKIAERLIVYDVFSPNNGDDKNNYFEIENAALYPGILVEVYTRWGEKLFSSKGYSDDQRWDGTFKGKDVPIGTYYYVIVPYKGAEALTGPLTIVR